MTAWYDGPCVVAEAPHPEAAYAFINHMLSAEVQAQLPKELGYAPANRKAIDMLDEQDPTEDMDLDALVANIDKIQFQYNLGGDFDKRGIEVWERAKAAVAKSRVGVAPRATRPPPLPSPQGGGERRTSALQQRKRR